MPCYQLTKTECLYIATKFNDEARAKLVLRWEELELQEQARRQQLCLPEPKEILRLADHIIGHALSEMNADAEDTLTATQGVKRLREWYTWMVDNLMFDQLIWETRPNGSKWIHVSYKSTGPNRQQVFTCRA